MSFPIIVIPVVSNRISSSGQIRIFKMFEYVLRISYILFLCLFSSEQETLKQLDIEHFIAKGARASPLASHFAYVQQILADSHRLVPQKYET